jgi:3-oxoacyl-[acyl-carrier protein] reductase
MDPATGKKLEGKVALITGGASGIGKGIAELFRREGAKVVVGDISVNGLQPMTGDLDAAWAVIEIDVTREAEVEKAVAAAVSNCGRLDIAVNCVGRSGFALLVDYTEAQWRSDIEICLTGTFLCMKHEGRQMIAQGAGGSIVNISSLSSVMPNERKSAYCSAKAAVNMLTMVGALEMGPHHVRVNAISPGLTATPMTSFLIQTPSIHAAYLDNIPLGRSGTTDDIASAALFLASDDASWITGENLLVDGGWHMKTYPNLFNLTGALQQ